ncbi:MAG: ATP-binding protein [Sporomusaceae bacterium]|nr:ATP-binding protein [Sporomusaceae bacterium]
MKTVFSLSLYYKINGIMIAMVLLLGLVMGIILFQSTSRLLDQEIEQQGLQLAESVAVLGNNDILLDDRYALLDLLNKTKRNSADVRYIFITDAAGRLLAHTFGPVFPQGLIDSTLKMPQETLNPDKNNVTVSLDSDEGPLREIILPIEKGTTGYVHVGMSEKRMAQLLQKRMFELVGITLIVCLLAAVAATYLARIIIQPVTSLAAAAREIGHGNFSVQAVGQKNDEVGRLARVFNEMAASLKAQEAENNRLLAELRNKDAMRTELMNKLICVQEEERKRISREIHDETGQSLTSLLAYMKVLSSKLTDEKQQELLFGAREVALHVLEGLRKLALELRPPILDDLGLFAAMEKYLVTFRRHYKMAVSFTAPDEKVILSHDVSLALYRILQESLTNVARHAKAKTVAVVLQLQQSDIVLTITDDGIGIAPAVLQAAKRDERLGLYGMKERAELVGGVFTFESVPGQGTTIRVIVPLHIGSAGSEKNG